MRDGDNRDEAGPEEAEDDTRTPLHEQHRVGQDHGQDKQRGQGGQARGEGSRAHGEGGQARGEGSRPARGPRHDPLTPRPLLFRDGALHRPAPSLAARRLPEELRSLGKALDGSAAGPAADSMAERVLARILAERVPTPVPRRAGPAERLRSLRRFSLRRRRALSAALCALLTVLALTPAVRASVVDWFDFGGVSVHQDPTAPRPPAAEVPECGPALSLKQAQRRAGFTPAVPAALGSPDAVTVTDAPEHRHWISLCWRDHGRTVRLDEYPAQLDMGFAKTVPDRAEWLLVPPADAAGAASPTSPGATASSGETPETPALWFARPHRLTFWMTDDDGHRWSRAERTAGPTLLWTYGGLLTLRLEGVESSEQALRIAASANAPLSGHAPPEPATP